MQIGGAPPPSSAPGTRVLTKTEKELEAAANGWSDFQVDGVAGKKFRSSEEYADRLCFSNTKPKRNMICRTNIKQSNNFENNRAHSMCLC